MRTHATAQRIARFNQYFTKCTELDAIISAAQEVSWLATHPGRIVIADANGKFICKVWNAHSYDSHLSEVDGPHLITPVVKHVGNYVIESLRPILMEVRSHFLTVEAPE
jgi:hypothetical protein